MANSLSFSISLTRDQALRYYQGHARFVIVRADNGQRVQFPAEHLRPFIGSDGVHGRFSIEFDSNNKLIGLKRQA